MNRQLRATGVIALLFGGLLVLSLLINVARQRSTPVLTPTSAPVELFPAVQAERITRISISRTGQRITLTRVPGDWQAVSGDGRAISVDLPNVTRIIQILATLRYNRVLEESRVADYGLAGEGQVSIDFDAGTSYHLRIGDAAPYADFTYVQRDADPAIYLVSSGALTPLTNVLPALQPTIAPSLEPSRPANATAMAQNGTAQQPGTPPETLAGPTP